MKKWFKLLSMAVIVASLAACSDDSESVEENPSESTATEGADVPVMDLSEDKGELTIEDAKEAVEYYALGGNDTLEAMTFEDGHIFYKISIAPHDQLPPVLLAETMYSHLGDELFKYTGWETLTVEFVELNRTVTFNYDEYEENEYGLKYFPSRIIEERLN